jgi:hypothetical protein
MPWINYHYEVGSIQAINPRIDCALVNHSTRCSSFSFRHNHNRETSQSLANVLLIYHRWPTKLILYLAEGKAFTRPIVHSWPGRDQISHCDGRTTSLRRGIPVGQYQYSS